MPSRNNKKSPIRKKSRKSLWRKRPRKQTNNRSSPVIIIGDSEISTEKEIDIFTEPISEDPCNENDNSLEYTFYYSWFDSFLQDELVRRT